MGASIHVRTSIRVHEHLCARASVCAGEEQQGRDRPAGRAWDHGRLQDRTEPPSTHAEGRRLERDLVGGLGCQIQLHPEVKFRKVSGSHLELVTFLPSITPLESYFINSLN